MFKLQTISVAAIDFEVGFQQLATRLRHRHRAQRKPTFDSAMGKLGVVYQRREPVLRPQHPDPQLDVHLPRLDALVRHRLGQSVVDR